MGLRGFLLIAGLPVIALAFFGFVFSSNRGLDAVFGPICGISLPTITALGVWQIFDPRLTKFYVVSLMPVCLIYLYSYLI